MCSEQSFDNHDSFYVPSLAMVQLTWDTTQNQELKLPNGWKVGDLIPRPSTEQGQ